MTTVAELVGSLTSQNQDATVSTTSVAPLAPPVWDVACAGTGFTDDVTRDLTCRGTGLIEATPVVTVLSVAGQVQVAPVPIQSGLL